MKFSIYITYMGRSYSKGSSLVDRYIEPSIWTARLEFPSSLRDLDLDLTRRVSRRR